MRSLYEELQRFEGNVGPPVTGSDEVCKQVIRHWCEAIEDDDPRYTDEDYASKTKYGTILAPPAMIDTFTQPPLWPNGQETRWRHPENLPEEKISHPHDVVMKKLDEAGFTGMFATKVSHEFVLPLFPGDRITRIEKFLNISPEKTTSVGVGHFFSFMNSYTNQRKELICKQTFTLFKYKPHQNKDCQQTL